MTPPFTLCGDSYAWGDEEAAVIGWNAIFCVLYPAGGGGGGFVT